MPAMPLNLKAKSRLSPKAPTWSPSRSTIPRKRLRVCPRTRLPLALRQKRPFVNQPRERSNPTGKRCRLPRRFRQRLPVLFPLYEYKCHSCGKVIEVIQKFSDEPLTTHADCGGELEKLISRSAFQLKGSGWYATDYPKGGGAPVAKPDDSKSGDHKTDSAKSESGSSENKSSESKPAETKSSENKPSETKPAPASAPSDSKS